MRISLVFAVLLALSMPASAQQVDPRLQSCIAHIVYGEAGNQPVEGKFAVAWSLVFRAAANMPDLGGSDICGVAYRYSSGRWQYDGAKIQPLRGRVWDESLYVAYMTLMGEGQPNLPVMYFCNPRVRGACSWHDKATDYVGEIEDHRFYLDPRFPALMQASVQVQE